MGAGRISALLLLVAAGAASASAVPAARRFVWVKTFSANVRSAPSESSPILSTPRFAARLLATGVAGGWTEVTLDTGQTGFVSSSLLTAAHPASVWVAAPSAPVLDRPLPGARAVATVPEGTELDCIGVGVGWDEVSAPDGTRGWVRSVLVAEAPAGLLFVRSAVAMVHVEASADSDVAAEVPAGTALQELGVDRSFYHVALSNGQTGWVFCGELGRQQPFGVFVTSHKAAIYARRTVDSTVVARAADEQELSAFGEDDGFYLVSTADGTTGWIWGADVIPIGGPAARGRDSDVGVRKSAPAGVPLGETGRPRPAE